MSKKNGATCLDSKCKDNDQLFSHPSHPHMLTLLQHEESEEDESDDESSGEGISDDDGSSGEEISDDDGPSEEKIKYCNGCNEVMCFSGYACQECKFYLHKSCAELPPKILHPLHTHPLTRSLTDEFKFGEALICDGCRDLYRSGFIFNCGWCGFNLDTKCASKQDQEHHQTFKELTLFHFYHKHALKLCNVESHTTLIAFVARRSSVVQLIVVYNVNSSSMNPVRRYPRKFSTHFTPQHILVTQTMGLSDLICAACKSLTLGGIKIGCNECAFELHVSCANPNRCALKHDCHQHSMYYFIDDITMGIYDCNNCHESCANGSFYRCVECDFNLHLKCIPIPSGVMITQKYYHHFQA